MTPVIASIVYSQVSSIAINAIAYIFYILQPTNAEGEISEQECKNRGCHWKTDSHPHVPWCFLDKSTTGYTSSAPVTHPNGIESTLTLKSDAKKSTTFAQIGQLKFQATHVTENILRLRITDPAHMRYEVPIQSEWNIPTATPAKTNYDVSLTGDFHLVVSRKGSAVKLIDTSIGGLVYSDQFLQFATYLGSNSVYGFGENYHLTLRRDLNYNTFPLYARDHGVGDVWHRNRVNP